MRKKSKSFMTRGYTLMEILVVVMAFSILGTIVTSVVSSTLRGSGKSENTVIVRENVSYTLGVIERHLRFAEEVITCTAATLEYRSAEGSEEEFTCTVSGGIGRINSTALNGQLSSTDISIDCTAVFSCPSANVINVTITGMDSQSVGNINAVTAEVTETLQIRLRDY